MGFIKCSPELYLLLHLKWVNRAQPYFSLFRVNLVYIFFDNYETVIPGLNSPKLTLNRSLSCVKPAEPSFIHGNCLYWDLILSLIRTRWLIAWWQHNISPHTPFHPDAFFRVLRKLSSLNKSMHYECKLWILLN